MSNSSLTNSVRFALATASLAQLHSQTAMAQEQDKSASENESMEEVIVTGSRVRRVDSRVGQSHHHDRPGCHREDGRHDRR